MQYEYGKQCVTDAILIYNLSGVKVFHVDFSSWNQLFRDDYKINCDIYWWKTKKIISLPHLKTNALDLILKSDLFSDLQNKRTA